MHLDVVAIKEKTLLTNTVFNCFVIVSYAPLNNNVLL